MKREEICKTKFGKKEISFFQAEDKFKSASEQGLVSFDEKGKVVFAPMDKDNKAVLLPIISMFSRYLEKKNAPVVNDNTPVADNTPVEVKTEETVVTPEKKQRKKRSPNKSKQAEQIPLNMPVIETVKPIVQQVKDNGLFSHIPDGATINMNISFVYQKGM
jgi:hypothetical protein